MSGGEIKCSRIGQEALDIEKNGKVTITGGTIYNDSGGKAIINSGTIKINGANALVRNRSTAKTYATFYVSKDSVKTTFSKGTIQNENSKGYCYVNEDTGRSKQGTWTNK